MMSYEILGPVCVQGSYVSTPAHQRRISVAAHRRAARRALLDLNKAVAGLLGMDPHYTISTNLAWRISARSGLSFESAKRLVHARIARYVAHSLAVNGIVRASPVVISQLIFEWLESFDSSDAW